MRRLPASMRRFHRRKSASGMPSIIKVCRGADMNDNNIDLSDKNIRDAVVSNDSLHSSHSGLYAILNLG